MPTAYVTGGSGFIGGALIERLLAEGSRTELGYAPVKTIDEGMEELRRAHLGRI